MWLTGKVFCPKSNELDRLLVLNSLFVMTFQLGSDGMHSKVREAMSVQYLTWKYNQSAIVATLKLREVRQLNISWLIRISSIGCQ